MRGEHQEVLQMVNQILKDRTAIRLSGVCLQITHRFWMPGTSCAPGEEVFDVSAVWAGRTNSLRYSTKQRVLIDYLSRYRIGQTATQIVDGIESHPFYTHYATNARRFSKPLGRVHRTSIKAEIDVLRSNCVEGFSAFNVDIDPYKFIESIKTGKEVRYRLRAVIKPIHIRY
jgi:hypothetical protein